MQEKPLDGFRVAALVSTDFEQVELTEPKKALEQAGARVQIVSPVRGQVQGMRHDQKADTFSVDLPLEQARVDDFDGLLIPGGTLNADQLRVVLLAQQFAQQFDEADRPIAVICHGPWLLVSSSLVHGRTLTSYHTLKDDIRNAGGRWLNKEAVRDRNWVSSRSPHDIPAFNREMIALFREYAAVPQRRRAA